MTNKQLQQILLASILTVQTGCTMIPAYNKPELPVADKWEKDSPLLDQKENSELARNIAWKDFFQSPQLQKVIQTALENNRDLKIAALNVQAARELYRIQRSDILPHINANVSGTRQSIPENASATGQKYINSQYNANIANTAFELDLFGKLRSKNQAALETYFATESARDAVQITLIAETANAYLQWMAERKILKLTEETLSAQKKSYDLISKSYKKGVGSKLDVAQVRTAVETAKANQALYKRNVTQDENALRLLMGLKDSDNILSDKQTLDDIKFSKNLLVEVPSQVLLERPDIKQSEYLLKSANANIGAARAAFFPTISLTGSYGFASSSLSSLFSGGASGAWSFVPQATLPIFQGGFNLANLKYTKTQKEIAVASYEKSIQVAFREVADELAALKTLSEELEARKQLVNATQEAYDLSYARYQQGIDNFLNVLDAQRSLFSAQQNVIQTERLLFSNRVNLYKALGGGVKG